MSLRASALFFFFLAETKKKKTPKEDEKFRRTGDARCHGFRACDEGIYYYIIVCCEKFLFILFHFCRFVFLCFCFSTIEFAAGAISK